MSKSIFKALFLMTLMILIPKIGFSQVGSPLLIAESEQKQEIMLLAGLAVSVKIFGPVAETQMTMTFYNPHNRQLVGDLYFPLPEGAFVSGYALDIGNRMVDGVIVEKHRGRQIFERLVRQRIDPGLVQWVKGNNFQTRVFPIPARGSRTVMVRYITALTFNNEGTFFHLPLIYKDKVKDFSLRVEVFKSWAKPKIRKSGFANFRFQKWQEHYVAEVSQKDRQLDKDLLIELPEIKKLNVIVEKSPEGEYYFLITDYPKSSERSKIPSPVTPKKIAIFWDASLSREKVDHEREFQILRGYFAGLKEVKIYVDLILFRNETEKAKSFTVSNGDCEELIGELKEVRYDGATQMGSLRPQEGNQKPNFYFLFSDGLSNFGREEPPALNAPLYIFSSDPASNHPFLHFLAAKNKGEYFNLKNLTDAQVLKRIGRPPFSFLLAAGDQSRIEELYPQNPRPAAGRFLLAGKLLSDEAKITLSYGSSGEIFLRRPYVIRRSEALEGELVKTFWAQKKIEELMIYSKHNERELVETGKKYGLVTPGTSLIVLDNLSQYLEFKVMPPRSLPEMRRQYLETMEKQKSEKQRQEQAKIDYILKLWKERLEWWNTDFMKQQSEVTKKRKFSGQTDEERRNGVTDAVAYWLSGRLTRPGIEGKVVDQASLPLSGVNISLTKDNRSWQRITGLDGYFAFTNIPAGTYKLRTSLAGLKTTTAENIRFRNNDRLSFSIMMSPGAVDDEISVNVEDIGLRRVEFDSGVVCRVVGGVQGGVVGGVLGGVVSEVEAPAPHADARFTSDGEQIKATGPTISLQAWNPQTPYLEKIKKSAPGKAYETYLEQREDFRKSPGFFLDCADYFFAEKQDELGLRILTNIAELELENASLLRVLGHRLRQLEMYELSAAVFEEVLKLRPEEPQSYRDLALVLASLKKYERAVELLNHVIMTKWDRFPEIELTCLMEMNEIIARAKAAGITEFKVVPQLIQLLDVDIRIVLTWDADMTDIDLYVVEPTEEKAFYGHNRTFIGGLISRDFTDGYGPEEYLIKKAMPGKYKVRINYFGSSAQTLMGPVTVQVDIFTNFGRPDELHKSVTVRLKDIEETLTITEIEF